MVLIGMIVGCLSCERPAAPVAATQPARPTRFTARIEPIAQLVPARRTHMAVDPAGNVYWTQEDPQGRDVMFIAGPGALPRATGLSSTRILAQLGVREGGSGNIQSIAAAGEGRVHFYFLGGTRRTTVACLGRYDLARDEVQVMLDTAQLQRIARMEQSLTLARGQLFAGGGRITLFLRHSDSWTILQLPPGAAAGEAAVEQPFTEVSSDEGPLNLSRSAYELAPGPGSSMLLTDAATGALWQIDRVGRAAVLHSLVGLPQEMSLPTLVDGDGIMIAFGDAEPIPPRLEHRAVGAAVVKQFPSLIIWSEQGVLQVLPEEIGAPAGFPVYSLQLEQLAPSPRQRTWVSFDGGSGQVLRLELVPRR